MESEKRPLQRCAECGGVVAAKRTDALFCAPACRQAFHRRQASRGQVLMPVALAWRGARNRKAEAALGKHAMMEMCRMLDAWAAEDRAAGRAPVLELAKGRLARNGSIGRD